MSEKGTINSIQNSNNNSKLIIIKKDRLTSAKGVINYITLKEGEQKLTMQINNNFLNKNEINKAVKTIKSQNLHNSKSNPNLIENPKLNSIAKKSFEKKFIKMIKGKENKKNNNLQVFNMETTRNNNFLETKSNNDNKTGNQKNDKIKISKLNINTQFEFTEDNKSYENEDCIDDILINDKIDNKNQNNKKNDFENKISENIELKKNEDNNSKKNNFLLKEKHLSSQEIKIEGKSEITKKLSSQEMSMNNNNDCEETKHIYIDSGRSKEFSIPINNNLIENNNQLTKLSKNNLNNKSEEISLNTNIIVKDGNIESAKVNADDNIKANYFAQNLITEMEGDEVSNKESNKGKEDLISDDKTIKIEENQDEDNSGVKEEEKNKENNSSKNDLAEKNDKEIIKVNNSNYKNNIKEPMLNINKINKNEIDRNINVRSLNFINLRPTPMIYNLCQICEHTLPMSRLFSAKCQKHYFCKKCIKSYYEDIIENGNRDLVCPFVKCKEPVVKEDLRNIISDNHYKMLTNNMDKNEMTLLFAKLKTDTIPENFDLYTEKHVLDVDTNKKFFSYNSIKEQYCSYCRKEALFSKINSHFSKCLNCEIKICKYCSKEFTNYHLDINHPDHCKVYYRNNDENQQPNKKFLKFLLELFLVCALFYLSFVGSFLLIRQMFYFIFNLKQNKNCIKYIFLYLFTFICFLVTIPIIFILFPVFPSLVSIFEF